MRRCGAAVHLCHPCNKQGGVCVTACWSPLLTGGVISCPGFAPRFQAELRPLVPDTTELEVFVPPVSDVRRGGGGMEGMTVGVQGGEWLQTRQGRGLASDGTTELEVFVQRSVILKSDCEGIRDVAGY